MKILSPQNRKKQRGFSSNLHPPKTRNFPWFWLTFVFFCYLILGIILQFSEAGTFAWTLAAAGAGAGAVAGALALAWVGAVAAAVAGAVAGALAGAGALAATWASAWAEVYLLKSFSRFHTFLILIGISWLGLGFGWLIASSAQ